MNLSIKKFSLLKWIVKDEFNHEFHPLMIEIKKKLNIKVNTFTLFLILFVYQYAFVFLLLLLLYNIRESSLFLIAFGVISLFNLILPSTIARTSIQRIRENPVFECLAMSELSLNQSKRLMILSELGDFWIHNFSFELISICLFVIKFKGLGIIYSIIWIIIVSFIFLRIVMKKADLHRLSSDSNSLRLYTFNLIVGGFVAYNIFDLFVRRLDKISMDEIFAQHGLSEYVKGYVVRIISAIGDKLFYLLILTSILLLLYVILRAWEKKIEMKKANVLKTSFLKQYIFILCKMTKNIFVRRDLKWVFNILSNLEINVFTVICPSGMVFLSVAYIFLVVSNRNQYATVIALDFIFWTVVYQYANYLVQKIPIFNISSELHNIELIKMSDRTIKQLIESKHRLLSIFCCPLLFLVFIEKISIAFMGYNLIIILVSLFIDILVFGICIILALKWTLILPKFDWDNIFMLKQDNFDFQILQQFLLVPSRIVTLYFSISFVFVNVVNARYSLTFMLLYYILTLMCIIIMYVLLKRRNKNEIEV